ncbi:DinB family protein [Pedobacter sp. ASV12]|uniref:DinB family protein n=1 Tax=Pedobacter sp. ASV12 TaxID=2795120 RepID=UPI0018EBD944|nr:DinB family protein [Pedobacter sp. ASV12]
METQNLTATESPVFASSNDILNQWLGHRRLTRRVIEAFPADQLFTHSIGGMRTFAEMIKEIIDISGPGVRGIATDNWDHTGNLDGHVIEAADQNKEALLRLFDAGTAEIQTFLPQISTARFQETVVTFGLYEGVVFSSLLYFIDNEIHHRAQGTVYLRSLGIEPPAFWNRN